MSLFKPLIAEITGQNYIAVAELRKGLPSLSAKALGNQGPEVIKPGSQQGGDCMNFRREIGSART